jgi:glycine betaine/proline transport system ATP-binding protein
VEVQAQVTDPKIRIERVSKLFGPDPQAALPLLDTDASKAEIMERTGNVVGLRNVTLGIAGGSIFVVMGLSGSGKSTLIRHINRLIEPTAGRILVEDTDVVRLSQAELRHLRLHRVSMVFQNFGLLPNKTVLDKVALVLRFAGAGKAQARELAMEQIERVGLKGFEKQYPRQLSGGMQQRVGLARALATDAEILLMDEAFSALDPLIRHDMQSQLLELQTDLKKTIVFITHDLDEALRIGDRIAILNDGSLSQCGTGEEILLHPADDYVKRFVRNVDRARVITTAAAARAVPMMTSAEISADKIARLLSAEDAQAAFVVDDEGRPTGAISAASIAHHADADDGYWRDSKHVLPVTRISSDTILADALTYVAASEVPVAVVDESGRLIGAISRRGLLEAMAGTDGPSNTAAPEV